MWCFESNKGKTVDWNLAADLDLRTQARHDSHWSGKRWNDPQARVFPVTTLGQFAWAQPGELAFLPAQDFNPATDFYLGDFAQRPLFMRLVPEKADLAEIDFGLPVTYSGLRAVLDQVDGDLPAVFAAAALANWHGSAQFCPRCGSATQIIHSGHARCCPSCDAEIFPRTDPAVIVSILDEDGRLLLGRQPVWAPLRVSVFAGFVEAGESAEQAIHREMGEEVGLTSLKDITYFGSQPWPFPRSLMLGYVARSASKDIHIDPAEIEMAQWFTVAQAEAAVASSQLVLPSPHSIAHRMISAWRAGKLTTK
jgi:NAD+ diphosphatase